MSSSAASGLRRNHEVVGQTMSPEAERVAEITPGRVTSADGGGALFEEIAQVGLDIRTAASERA
jgi:hypothetical protein